MSYRVARYRRPAQFGLAASAIQYGLRNPDQVERIRQNALSLANRGFGTVRDFMRSYQSRQAVQRSSRQAAYATRRSRFSAPMRRMVRGNAARSRYSYRRPLTRKRRGTRTRRTVSKRKKSNSGFLGTLWKSLCTPQTFKETVAFNRTGNQGQRSWASMELCGQNLINSVLGAKRPSNFLFNTAAGASSTATLQDIGQKNWQCKLTQHLFDTRLQNRSNACMELKIYECVVRHDVKAADFDKSINAAFQLFEQDMDPVTLVGSANSNLGPAQASFPTGVTHAWNHPAFTPYMSNEFVNYFKILKTESIRLGPNEIVSRRYRASPRLFKGNEILSTLSTEWQKGWSKLILFSWVGMPLDDGTTANQTKAKTDLFVQYDMTMKFHYLPGQDPLYNLGFGNSVNSIGTTYSYNPAPAFVAVVPATGTMETVAAPADTCPVVAP